MVVWDIKPYQAAPLRKSAKSNNVFKTVHFFLPPGRALSTSFWSGIAAKSPSLMRRYFRMNVRISSNELFGRNSAPRILKSSQVPISSLPVETGDFQDLKIVISPLTANPSSPSTISISIMGSSKLTFMSPSPLAPAPMNGVRSPQVDKHASISLSAGIAGLLLALLTASTFPPAQRVFSRIRT